MNKNRNWWKRSFGGFGATAARMRKRKRAHRLESLESRNMMTINLAAADLSYLLEQVNIGNDYTQLFGPLDPGGVREVSGANNNLVGAYDANGVFVPGTNPHGDWGQSDTDFLRIFTTDHPNNGTSYGFTFDPVSMRVIDDNGQPILGSDGQPVIVPASFATQFAEGQTIGTPVPGTSPRTVTQLVANSDVNPDSPTYNPAAHEAMLQMGGEAVAVSNSVVGTTQTAFIPNPGILGGVPYNEFFVEFGQFFDHGLDFITKGGGFVLIPLSPSDPLYNPSATGPTANKMMLSRGALANPASDFNIDGLGNAVLKPGVAPAFNNNTGLMIDQSQTYGSISTINALVRQYDSSGHVTGKLITSAEDMAAVGVAPTPEQIAAFNRASHDLATWADMKVNAARLGIELIDRDVLDAPMIKADAVGKILFTPQHAVMYRSDTSIADTAGYNAANDPFVRWSQADADAHRCLASQVGYARQTGHAVISDMGNAASPMSPLGQMLVPMGTTDRTAVPGAGQYNEAMLASHYVSGDHRANENVGLTAMHHIFHEEHNIQADAIKAAVTAQAALLNDSTPAGIQAEANYLAQWQTAPGVWNGEKIYQAARIITETEYNHISIDQYVGGLVVMPEFVSYSSDINLDVSLEFSQAVFRLGHSQLSETMQIAVADGNGVKPGEAGYIPTYNSVGLFDAFLNPALYESEGPGGIMLGLLNQQGNEIDEFVTAALQQSLVGQPLDLAALNISRGRDVGLPTLNEARQQIFDGLVNNTSNSNTNGPGIAPYTSWEDFGGHLRHPESLVNFIAAYGREDDVFNLATMRRAYEAGSASGTDSLGAFDATASDPTPGDGVITLKDLRANAQVILKAAADAGDPLHDSAVLFMRGQGSPVFDPVTGTWNQNNNGGGDAGFWDVDLWIGGLAEQPLFDGPLGTTFTFIMADFGQRMQDADRFYYLYRMPVGHHLGDQIIGEQFADLIMRTTGLEHVGDAFGFQSATFTLDGNGHDNPYDGVGAADTYGINDYFNAIYETLPGGGSANDGHLIVVGLEGNDYIVAALGDDYVYGDAGSDVIEGAQGNDHLYGGPGNDWITDYENDDFIHGGDGNDYLSGGPGVLDTLHGGNGNDEVHGGDGIDEVFGDDGDDLLYGEGDTDLMMGGDGHDYMEGGDSVDEMFGGNGSDWMRGGVGDDNINGGSGNDLLEGGLGPTANDGDRLNGDTPITRGITVIEANGDGTEGDNDIGSYERVGIPIFASLQDSNANGTSSNLADTYAFLEGLVGSAQNDKLTGADASTTTSSGPNNYLIGGGGGDELTGLGDDRGLDPTTGLPAASRIDYIFGGSVVVDNNLYWIGDDRHVASGHGNVTGTILNWMGTGETRVVFQDGSLGHILGDNGADGVDTAIYRGNRADYQVDVVVVNGQQAIRIADLRDPADATFDGVDVLVDVEFAKFADQTISIVATPLNLDLQAFTVGNFLDNFDSPSFSNSNGTTAWTSSWTETGDFGGVTAGQIRIDAGTGAGTNQMRFHGGAIANFNGASIDRVVNLTGAVSATLSFNYAEVGFDAGETVLVQFAADGVNFTTVQTINGASGTGASNLALTGPFGPNSTVRFEVSAVNSSTERVEIDNVNIAFSIPLNDASNDYATTYTEDGAPVAIASAPGISGSGSPNMQSAKIELTNAKAGDVLSVSGALPGGIASSIDLTVPGAITLNLSGNATRAAYQAAIAQIRFANSSQNPDTTLRTIQATVFDGATTSTVATAAVTVIAVDDPAILGADRLRLNAPNTDFVVPESAFLANDVDPDSVLDITAVSAPAGLGTLSLALNPGAITVSDTGTANGSFSYTAGGATANVSVVLDTGTMLGTNSDEILVDGAGVNNTLSGSGGNDIILARDGDDTLVGGTGNDQMFGEAGNDTFTYAIGNGADAVDGGTQTTADVLNITGGTAADTLDVIYNGTALISFEGGTLVDVESVTANLDGGTDTLTYAGTTAAVTVNLGTGTASGFTTITNIENVTGGSGADTLTGTAGANSLNGGDGGDLLTGGDGNDSVNTGAADDNVPDRVRWGAVAEFGDGDTVSNFDATGTVGQIDRVEFVSPALLALFDDGTALPDGVVSWVTGDGTNNNNVAVNLDGTTEALFLDGTNSEGVTNANLTSATAVAAEFNAEFALTATNGEATLLVINDTNGNSAALWRWVQAGGGEMAGGELTLIGIINANATVTTDSVGFDLGAPLLAASVGVPTGTAGGKLNQSAIQNVAQAAIADWARAGLSPELLNSMRQVQFVVTDMPGAYLGMAVGNTIYLDTNAAGYGWFVDSTPNRNEEFGAAASAGNSQAIDPRAVDRIDLLSVVAHELGHIAGLNHQDLQPGGLMDSTLAAGVRNTAWSSAVDMVQTSGGSW